MPKIRVKKKKPKRVPKVANLSPMEVRKLKRLHQKWQKETQPLTDAAKKSAKFTGEDLAVRINTKA